MRGRHVGEQRRVIVDHAEWVRDHLFPAAPPAVPRIGAEVELLAWDAETNEVARLDGGLGEWLDATTKSDGWTASGSDKGAPKFEVPGLGTITLEPGGQIEYSSLPHETPRRLIEELHHVGARLQSSAAHHGIALHALGIDPLHALDRVPLQLHGDRYTRMDEYFRTIGDAGPRMMRQTAAFQVSIDPSHDPALTWRVLNRVAPLLVAMFANSRIYDGRDTGCASYRALTWQELDATRTGIVGARATTIAEAAAQYGEFALNARCIADTPLYRPFEELADGANAAAVTNAAWEDHLTTLFPEVRPKKYYEVRCIDAIPLEFAAVPVLVVAAIAWDSAVMQRTTEMMDVAYNDLLLQRGALIGVADAELRALAGELLSMTVTAAERAGDGFARAEDVEAVRLWKAQLLAA